ncbi:tetratricopeptide repeat protein [Streptomyces ipomoeae]|uniref:Tetratricopeptide repeat protein n=1 Tax=Streptomyces ipomoeae 91-03 TaxID=698759 RepID=L1KI38_9ACTN|nr:tetratricopeptide repeat protein [Streptomyces ipomoeae]EKX60237.1 tetratricopeptide repeat protein [Streptomyces ipomoeae 91-03]MDX2694152.1 tetratricopeptide repeat protein [Streptomyces ipomoeae]MDX2821561.1 tetratricopeptide repeat protein [Streptomyces ipomoeae]MDX2840272.1 tetratricopeptide repeat protein [Streptomyces ipomoeae]MDX2873116.1 tetratricopeptide repeat protein [Streptomyces ipomoeae]
MGDSYVKDIAEHPACEVLLTAWQCPDAEQRRALVRDINPPGPIALRSRYRMLLDPEAPSGPWNPELTPEAWVRQLRLETEGDNAVRSGSLAVALTAFRTLLEEATGGRPQLSTVHAHLGLGKIAMEGNDIEAASEHFETAAAVADDSMYRFGRTQTLVHWAYMTLWHHSAELALEQFREAAEIAGALDDPVFQGNALLGAAECAERLGELDRMEQHGKDAYATFLAVRSAHGQGNAAQRLAGWLHRRGRHSEAWEWLDLALAAFQQDGNPTGLVNLHSLRGDLYLDERRFDEAEAEHSKALELAMSAGLSRARAHAVHDLGRTARGRGKWAEAAQRFTESLERYREIGDLLGMSHALGKLAEAQEECGWVQDALRTWREAVVEVESYRADHQEERFQEEYRRRFRAVYEGSLSAAEKHGSAETFAVVADFLAGRRLAGLLEANSTAMAGDELDQLQELLAGADRRLLAHRRTARSDDDRFGDERRENRIRRLGALDFRQGAEPPASKSLDDLLAAVYLPPADEGGALLEALPAGCHALQLLLDPVDEDLVRWSWSAPGNRSSMGSFRLTPDALDLLSVLSSGDQAAERQALTADDLRPLSALLPPPLMAALASSGSHDLLIVPAGELWRVPWGAVPLESGRLLGEVAKFAVCPSLTIQRQLATRTRDLLRTRSPLDVDVWRSPLVICHPLDVFQDRRWNPRRLSSAAEARGAIYDGRELMVLTGHGRPRAETGHYLELDDDEWLLPTDLLGRRPPRRLALIACWGSAYPGRTPSDPISIATLALAGGSDEVLATVGELGDSVPATRYVEMVLDALPENTMAAAVHQATRRFLARRQHRSLPMHHWAPLIPIGTHRPLGGQQ